MYRISHQTSAWLYIMKAQGVRHHNDIHIDTSCLISTNIGIYKIASCSKYPKQLHMRCERKSIKVDETAMIRNVYNRVP